MISATRQLYSAGYQATGRWAILGLTVAVALGSTSAVNGRAALALVLVIALVSAVSIRPSTSILFLLTISMFLGNVKIGGAEVGRIVAPVALAVATIEVLRGQARIRVSSPLLWVVAYSLWALASGLWTGNLGETARFLASLAIALTYMGVVAVFIQSPRELKRFLFFAASAAFVTGLVSLGAYLHWFTLFRSTLQAGRAQGGVGDPNFFANLQLVVLPFLLALVPEGRRSWHRFLLCFAALVVTGSVLASLSRGGILGLVAIGLLIALLPSRTLFASPRQKGLVMLVLLSGTALCFALPSVRHGVTARVGTLFQANDLSTASESSGRRNIWLAAGGAFSRHPVLGIGAGSFLHASNDLMLDTPGVDLVTYDLRPRGEEVHNTFLGTATELGLPGLALLLGLLISAAISLRRAAVRARRAGRSFITRIANAALVSLAAWAVTAFFLETETSRPIWVLIGLCIALPKLIPGETLRRAT